MSSRDEGAGDLLRALSGPVFWALLVGGGLHWLIYTQTRARPDWGAIDSWRSLAPGVINVANVGQTVPSLLEPCLRNTCLALHQDL